MKIIVIHEGFLIEGKKGYKDCEIIESCIKRRIHDAEIDWFCFPKSDIKKLIKFIDKEIFDGSLPIWENLTKKAAKFKKCQ